jgi:DNA (cytosine-5)-methyltransferase 1
MIYGSVCSGIEAATVAWHPLGWRPAFFSEIEKFPSAVLAHHYPDVLNLGDLTQHRKWNHDAIDLLVGGTPCQSFSVAGLRKGLDDPRGNLALEFLALADRTRPRWLVWENVPGVLSSKSGRDFGSFLGALGKLGYGFAYRVLDAQYIRVDGFPHAVPQRRRRVFVVGYLGDWRRAAAVLFERESLSGNPSPRREAGKRVAPTISARTSGGGGLGTDFDCDGGLIAMATGQGGTEITTDGGGPTLTCNHEAPIVAHALRGEGFDASEDGTGRGTPIVPISFGGQMSTPQWDHDLAQTLQAKNPAAVAIQERAVSENLKTGPQGRGYQKDIAYTLEARNAVQAVQHSYAVRRLTPRECERLQGFPDDYTWIPWRGKSADFCPDGPRYKALGNSMAVNVMRWIGQRIAAVDAIGGGT